MNVMLSPAALRLARAKELIAHAGALIFDVDGTLAETEEVHRQAFNEAFVQAGIDWCWGRAIYKDLLRVAGGKERIRAFDRMREKEPMLADQQIAELHRIKTARYVELVASGGCPLRPGVEALMDEAKRRGQRLAIATTTSPANVEALLETALPEGQSWFDVVGAGDIVSAKKPAPDIYNYVLSELRIGADSCLAFEDSINGLRSSLGADVETVVTVNGYTADQDFAGAAIVLDQLGEPDAPFQVIEGEASGTTYVDVALLDTLFTQPQRT